MFSLDHDDNSPFSPSGDLEDDSLLDEVLMETYEDEDGKEAEAANKTEAFDDMDDADDGDDLDEEEDLLPGE